MKLAFSIHPRLASRSPTSTTAAGFTLIEMSIVLVIIGLIIGGILVGRDLISAAAARAQISQIEKYNSAVNTFYGKYSYLPGDIPAPYATNFGFEARGQYAGEGDGNGIIEGVTSNSPNDSNGISETEGETVMFWVDLSTANLVEGGFSTATFTTALSNVTLTSSPSLSSFFPTARIGNGNFVYVYSGSEPVGVFVQNNVNYFGVSALTQVGSILSNPGISVAQAYSIDKKIDDGFPQTGRVLAQYLTSGDETMHWATNPIAIGTAPYTSSTPASPLSCFDNGTTPGAAQQYSVGQNNGSGINCALSFQMQGAAR